MGYNHEKVKSTGFTNINERITAAKVSINVSAKELNDETGASAAEHFADTHFFGPLNRLCRGQIDESSLKQSGKMNIATPINAYNVGKYGFLKSSSIISPVGTHS